MIFMSNSKPIQFANEMVMGMYLHTGESVRFYLGLSFSLYSIHVYEERDKFPTVHDRGVANQEFEDLLPSDSGSSWIASISARLSRTWSFNSLTQVSSNSADLASVVLIGRREVDCLGLRHAAGVTD